MAANHENLQDYQTAADDKSFAKLASEGILLTNYFALTHPSEPNYGASASGDTFGMDNDDFHQIPANVSTIADLFDTKGIAWGQYQEGLPYAGYQVLTCGFILSGWCLFLILIHY